MNYSHQPRCLEPGHGVLDRFGALNAFVQVAESQSLAGAGQRLGLSPAAVSSSVTQLERRLGVRLLQRGARHVALTSEGQFFLECCRRIFAEIAGVERELAQTKGVAKGRPAGRAAGSENAVRADACPFHADLSGCRPRHRFHGSPVRRHRWRLRCGPAYGRFVRHPAHVASPGNLPARDRRFADYFARAACRRPPKI